MSMLILFGGGVSSVTLTAVDGTTNVLAEKRGGTVVTLTGTGFDSSMSVAVLSGGSPIGEGYIFDPVFDVPSSTTAYVGLPAMEPGTEGYVQLRMHEPVATQFGQRFIIRHETSTHTLGGGSVLRPGAWIFLGPLAGELPFALKITSLCTPW